MSNISFTQENLSLLKIISDEIPTPILRRGMTYYKNNAVINVTKKGNILTATVQDTIIQNIEIDLTYNDYDYDCDCDLDLPCKHIASVIVWILEKDYEKTLEKQSQNVSVPSIHACDLIFILDEFLYKATAHAKKENTIIALRSFEQLGYLSYKWNDLYEELLKNHYDSIQFGYGPIPPISLRKLIQGYPKNTPLNLYYRNIDTPLSFGGYIDCNALIIGENFDNNNNKYNIHFYYHHPLQNQYRIITIYQLSEETGRLLPSTPLSINEIKLNEYLEKNTKIKTNQHTNNSKKNTPKQNIDNFYIFSINNNLKELSNIVRSNSTITKDTLYKNQKIIEPFITFKLEDFFSNICQYGPYLGISMYVDTEESIKQIKGYIEVIYTHSIIDTKNNISIDNFKSNTQHKVAHFKIIKDKNNSFLDVSDSGYSALRNLELENNVYDALDMPILYKKNTGEFSFSKKGLQRFIKESLPILKNQNILFNFHESLYSMIQKNYKTKFVIHSSSGLNWFEGEINIEGVSEKDKKEILQAYYNQDKMIELSNHEWVFIKDFNIGEIIKVLQEVGIKLSKNGKTAPFNQGQFVALKFLSTDIIIEDSINKVKNKFIQSLYENEAVDSPNISPTLNSILRSYQKEGVAFLHKLFSLKVGGILADDMGLGKTLQSIAFIDSLVNNDNKSIHLVVCPLAAISVWELECKKFLNNISIQMWHGHHRKAQLLSKNGLIITTFFTLSQDINLFQNINFTTVFIDEAQNIKNTNTKISKTLRLLKTNSFFCLTGTPIENYFGDLWSLMDLTFPGLLGTQASFRKKYGSSETNENKDLLLKKIAPFILRRKKEQVLKELPAKTENLILLPFTDSQLIIYEQIRKEATNKLKVAGNDYLMLMLPYLMKLRRICCYLDLSNQDKKVILENSNKLSYLKEKLNEIKEGSTGVLIFSQFTDLLKKVALLLDAEEQSYFYLDGTIRNQDRKEMTEKFQNGDRHFFLISLKAGGTALTLHRADTVIHLDPWWNPAVENQATDRAHRIGQKNNVFVYKLITKDSIEEKVVIMQNKKKKIFEDLFNEDNPFNQNLSKDDLMEIFDSLEL